MKILVTAATLALLATPAFAQSTSGSQNQQANQNQQGLVAAQKIKQDLQREGFKDVKIVAESFVVQGKSPEGNPVLMTIGPHGMSVFEAMNSNSSNSGTVGSSSGSQNGTSGSSSNPSTNSNSGTQQK
jgi:hypothetical protein